MTRTCLSGTGGVDYIHDQNMLVRNRWCRLYSWPKHACQEPVVSTIHDQKMLVRNRWYRHFLCKMSHYQIQLWHSQLQICIPLSIRRGVYNSEPRNVTLYISYLATEWLLYYGVYLLIFKNSIMFISFLKKLWKAVSVSDVVFVMWKMLETSTSISEEISAPFEVFPKRICLFYSANDIFLHYLNHVIYIYDYSIFF